MFIHDNRKVGGYRFKQRTFYNTDHRGTDWSAKYENVYAPCDGVVTETPYGSAGGQWIHFEEEGTPLCEYFGAKKLIHRIAHLSKLKVKAGTKVKEGDVIAISGNSGKFTTGPHSHHDISKDKFDLHDLDNFIDPEVYFDVMEREQETPDWAEEAVKWNKDNGIMEDTERPLDNITRAEAAVINQRMYELIMQDVKDMLK